MESFLRAITQRSSRGEHPLSKRRPKAVQKTALIEKMELRKIEGIDKNDTPYLRSEPWLVKPTQWICGTKSTKKNLP